jgi:hypothetical protein
MLTPTRPRLVSEAKGKPLRSLMQLSCRFPEKTRFAPVEPWLYPGVAGVRARLTSNRITK